MDAPTELKASDIDEAMEYVLNYEMPMCGTCDKGRGTMMGDFGPQCDQCFFDDLEKKGCDVKGYTKKIFDEMWR
jgi:hypothetical protein